jgi:hypothetical protein
MKKILLTVGLLLTSLSASQYDANKVLCNHDLDKSIALGQELQKAIINEDEVRADALMFVLHETTESMKETCKAKM